MKIRFSSPSLMLSRAFEQFLEVSSFAQRTRESYMEDLVSLFAQVGYMPVSALTALPHEKSALVILTEPSSLAEESHSAPRSSLCLCSFAQGNGSCYDAFTEADFSVLPTPPPLS
jgi:hypothetical protein